MLPKLSRLSNDQYTAQVTVEWKGYITAEIDWNFRATNLYWQLVDPKFSQLELGFEHPSGRLVKCAVPLFNGDVEDQRSEVLLSATPGTPFFDLSPWPLQVSEQEIHGNHIEQPGRIRLARKHNGLSIICRNNSPRRSVIYADSLVCDFGEGDELVAITLVGDFPL